MTISCSGGVTEEIFGVSVVCNSDSSVEFRIFGDLFRCGLGSFDNCSTKNTSESIDMIDILEAILNNL